MARAKGSKRLLWPISLAIPTVVLIGAVVAGAAGYLLWLGFGRPPLVKGWDAATQLDTLRIALIVTGGLGGVIALVVAYRKQKVAEQANTREDSRLFNERFMAACTALGHDSAAVRLAAVAAIARLADDWVLERQVCIDVLCSYLRLPYQPVNRGGEPKYGEQEVRWSIIRTVCEHLRLGVTHPRTWQGKDLDFRGAVFDGGDFADANFSAGRVFSTARGSPAPV
jgi:hypothetical protein